MTRSRLAPLASSFAACALLIGVSLAQEVPDAPPPAKDADKTGDAQKADPPPAPEKDDEESEARALAGVEYFPLDLGRRWRYRVQFRITPTTGGEDATNPEGSEGEHHVDVYVADPVKIGDQSAASLESKLDQVLSQRAYFRLEKGVLRCLKRLQGASEHVKEFMLTPAQPALKAALKVGEAWSWEGKSGPSNGKQTWKVVRAEDLELPAGHFKTLVVESEFTGEDDSRGKTTRWLASGIGLVKEISQVRTPKHIFHTTGVLIRFEKP